MTKPESTPVFKPARAMASGAVGRIPWDSVNVEPSLDRITAAPTMEAVVAQALTEQVVLLHSIRRILVWTLVLIPIILTAIGITLILLGQAAAPENCSPYLSSC